ncbi:hypothetical protein FO519_004298 [Halicephalobus sp. NKZ332]|nr:hypothetical protein FO519_004298 [Halicephalobus sp. NKZ332]
MSIVGIDLGCYSTYIAGIKDGTVEVLANEYSLLATPTAVAFNSIPRSIGVPARQLVVSKFKSTVAFFKPLLRRDADHGGILDAIPCKCFPVNPLSKDLYASVEVYNHQNEPVRLEVQQVLGAYLTKLFDIARASTGVIVEECFLTVPYYYTISDRQVILEAAKIAGFPFIKLINETAALAASYAFFKKTSLPASNEPPKKIVFVDVGYSQAQISMAEVHKDGARVVLAQHSTEVGGYYFDNVIREYFAAVFMETKKLNAKNNRKAWLRLAEEAEKAKKSTSAAYTKVISQVECLMEDTDFKAEIDRVKFEELAADIFSKFEKLIVNFLHEAQVNPVNVEVELVGGSSRIPAIRAIVERNFQQLAKTTMNQDEAVVRGSALMAGLLSPRVRASQFKLQDFVPEAVLARYKSEKGEFKYATIFKRGDSVPSRRHATFPVTEVDLFYSNFANSHRQDLLHISNVVLNSKNEPNPHAIEVPRYRFTFSYELDQLIYCNTITRVEKELPPPEPEPTPADNKDGNEGGKDEKKEENAQNSNSNPQEQKDAQQQNPPGPPQPRDRETRMNAFSSLSSGVDQVVKQIYIDAERKMRHDDEQANIKAEAKNSLESYFYEIRDKMEMNPGLFIPEKMESFQSLMNNIDEFLYEDDSELSVDDYSKKHADLQEAYNASVIHQVKIEEVPANTEAMDVDPPRVEEPAK